MPVTNPTATYRCERYGYTLPTIPAIMRVKAGDLYAMEERRSDLVITCAERMQKIMGWNDLWKVAVPESLAALLDSMDTHAAAAAAIAYLHKQGYTVTDNGRT